MIITAIVHVGDIFTGGLKIRCDRFRRKLNHLVPVKKFEGLGVFTPRGTGRGVL